LPGFSLPWLREIIFKILFFSLGMIVDKIIKNNEFWKKIEPLLIKFYMDCLLPELIDSRFDRGLPLRTGL